MEINGLDKFTEICEKISSEQEAVKNFIENNKTLGVGFSEYFRMSILSEINAQYGKGNSVSLMPYYIFKNSDDQKKTMPLTNLKKCIEFRNSNGNKYLISICIQEYSTFDKILGMDFLRPLFRGIDHSNDVIEVNTDDSELQRMVLEYEVSFQSNKEPIYVSISKL